MGLFDFLKPKKNSIAEFEGRPEVKHAMMAMKLEYLQKQVANLKAVGRADDADNAIIEYIEEYSRTAAGSPSTPHDLARLSYRLAYMFLPDLVHKRWEEFLRLWNDGISFPIYLALQGAIIQKQRLTPQQILEFKAEAGRLSSDLDFYLVQFPTPPTSGANINIDAEMLQTTPPEKWPVLGPYFTAVLNNKQTGQRHLYILGQAPHSGTTLRCVTAEGVNCNCGPGPDPSVKAFLEVLRQGRLT